MPKWRHTRPQSAHHPNKSHHERRRCNPGRGLYFAALLGSDTSHTTNEKYHHLSLEGMPMQPHLHASCPLLVAIPTRHVVRNNFHWGQKYCLPNCYSRLRKFPFVASPHITTRSGPKWQYFCGFGPCRRIARNAPHALGGAVATFHNANSSTLPSSSFSLWSCGERLTLARLCLKRSGRCMGMTRRECISQWRCSS